MQDIKTRFLVISDTHAEKGLAIPDLPVDVAIHCGDLTNESKLDEFRTTLDLLRTINAPLKLVIAGNHDFTLDTPMFMKKRAQAEAVFSIEPGLIKKEYGDFGDARQLFGDARVDGIVFLDQGVHHFNLDNGASLTVHASAFTPSVDADWGFQYKRGEHYDFAINNGVDVVITHGPPKGVLDLTASKQRGGCEHLFAAVARARPRLHCFGHIHEGWGAKLVAWRDTPSESPHILSTSTTANRLWWTLWQHSSQESGIRPRISWRKRPDFGHSGRMGTVPRTIPHEASTLSCQDRRRSSSMRPSNRQRRDKPSCRGSLTLSSPPPSIQAVCRMPAVTESLSRPLPPVCAVGNLPVKSFLLPTDIDQHHKIGSRASRRC
ncbi:Metallo-dependent phosphatase [Canariomyces notabilis]|uniref:Metallo-dependent phosphatase n=1 Tax=Canariomyces notabilis TaxID=2074819 RepID=A0AAN6TFC4_9PEZI|nr:Metallo-dependent phosphatase [Canariomyces arenarius]